ncbi:MAG: chemotaxis protein CheW [candidate division WOR-3 bacterium]
MKAKQQPKNIAKKKISKSLQGSTENIPGTTNKVGSSLQERGFAIFAVGNEWYAVDMDAIFEILHDFEISAASHLPDFFEGITDLRGESIPVVNLKNLLKIDPGENDSQVCLISEFENKKTGFLIDSDIEIVKSSDIQFFALPDCYSADEKKFLEGIIEHKTKLIGVLRLNQVLKVLTERRS